MFLFPDGFTLICEKTNAEPTPTDMLTENGNQGTAISSAYNTTISQDGFGVNNYLITQGPSFGIENIVCMVLQKIRDTAHRLNGVWRPVGYAMETASPNKNIRNPAENVKKNSKNDEVLYGLAKIKMTPTISERCIARMAQLSSHLRSQIGNVPRT